MILWRIGELFFEFGLTSPLTSPSRLSLYISFCISIIFTKTAKISASAWLIELKVTSISSNLLRKYFTGRRADKWQELLLGNKRIQLRLVVHSFLVCRKCLDLFCTIRRGHWLEVLVFVDLERKTFIDRCGLRLF